MKEVSTISFVTERGNGFYAWDGKLYHSDTVRACIRPKVKAIGKLVAKHIKETTDKNGKKTIKINPDVYIKFLLEEPNQYMTGQMMQEKIATQLCLNNNAFVLVMRDENGLAVGLYPIIANGCEAIYSKNGELFLRFYFKNGKTFTFAYSDIIHLRRDFNENEIFGEPIGPALEKLMEIVTTTDQGIVKAIRNGSFIRWLLKFSSALRPEDIEKQTKSFAEQFLNVDNGTGVAGVDVKSDAQQVKPNDYVPNAAQMDRTKDRIHELFNTNNKIVNSSRDEDEWNSYFDAEIEPDLLQMQGEYSRKIFSRKLRVAGNKIIFEASSWDSASIKTKLSLFSMVDRGSLTPNEWRATFNLAPVPGGDEPIRRLDTKPTLEGGEMSED